VTDGSPPGVLVVIPARGGSKGIPRKNLRILADKPLVVHSIEHALAAETIGRTIVSTDDLEIAEVAQAAGAEVPFLRPEELAQDDSPDIDVFRHALHWLEENERYRPELIVHLRPTNPGRRVERIDEAVRAIAADPSADSLRSVSWPAQTPYKMWRIEGGYLRPVVDAEDVPESHSLPRQLLPEVWWQNGFVDIVRRRTVVELGSMAGRRILPFAMTEPVVEIDYEDAFQRAEQLLLGAEGEKPVLRRHPA
jgi:CMP-N,N'-diacetyllegionaminic acid synthase